MEQARYVLMNKNTPVMSLVYDLENHVVTDISELICPQAAPLAVFAPYISGRWHVERSLLNAWWQRRVIPASRDHLRNALEVLPVASLMELLEKNFGLSLSDQYWLNDIDEPLTWDEINFFTNTFSDDVGHLLLGERSHSGSDSFSLRSPDASTDGVLRKRWKIIDNKRCLLKAGTGYLNQEPYNEVIATRLYTRLLAAEEYVPYRLYTEHNRVYSACENMLNSDEELIPAAAVRSMRKPDNSKNAFDNYVACVAELGLEPAATATALSKMLVCDFIVANHDRHYNNFGLIRNVETLTVTRTAPLFDAGSSLFTGSDSTQTDFDFAYSAKPFNDNPRTQLAYAQDYSWFDPAALAGFTHEVADLLAQSPLQTLKESEAYIQGLVSGIEKRIELVSTRARQYSA
jgi:hypothetical protein